MHCNISKCMRFDTSYPAIIIPVLSGLPQIVCHQHLLLYCLMIEHIVFDITCLEIEGGPQRCFAMLFWPNFSGKKKSKRRNSSAKCLQGPSSLFWALKLKRKLLYKQQHSLLPHICMHSPSVSLGICQRGITILAS
jgi:hypothetical protein